MAGKSEGNLMEYLDIMKGEKMIKKELLPYVDFVELNDIETVWRIYIKKTFVLGSKNPDYADPYGINEILEKLEALINAIEKYRV